MSSETPHWSLTRFTSESGWEDGTYDYWAVLRLKQDDAIYAVRFYGTVDEGSPLYGRYLDIESRASLGGADIHQHRGFVHTIDPMGRKYFYRYGPIQEMGFRSAQIVGDPMLGPDISEVVIAQAKPWSGLGERRSGDEFCGLTVNPVEGQFRSIEFAENLRRFSLLMGRWTEVDEAHDLTHGEGYALFGPTLWGLLINKAKEAYPLLTNQDFFRSLEESYERKGSPALLAVKEVASVADSLSERFRTIRHFKSNSRLEDFIKTRLYEDRMIDGAEPELIGRICEEAHERRQWLLATTPRYQLSVDAAEKIVEGCKSFLAEPHDATRFTKWDPAAAFERVVGSDLSDAFYTIPAPKPEHRRPPQLVDSGMSLG